MTIERTCVKIKFVTRRSLKYDIYDIDDFYAFLDFADLFLI